jgi:hypothetical protein
VPSINTNPTIYIAASGEHEAAEGGAEEIAEEAQHQGLLQTGA